MRLLPHDAWLAVPVAWLAFLGVAICAKSAMRIAPKAPPWAPHAVMKLALLAVALGAAAIEGLSSGALGFQAPVRPLWGASIGLGMLLGAAGTIVMLLAGIEGFRKVVGQHSFASIVLWFWIVSSVAEEVFCRGWFQGSTSGATPDPTLSAMLPSAVLFGSIHLVLFRSNIERSAVVMVVASTTVLGLLAAWARGATGSIYPAIAAHVAFNVGGAVGGAMYVGAYRAIHGRMPAFLKSPAAPASVSRSPSSAPSAPAGPPP